jgi:hypothetical protein
VLAVLAVRLEPLTLATETLVQMVEILLLQALLREAGREALLAQRL